MSGAIIAIGSLTVLGQRGIFLTSAVLTLIGLAIIAIASRTPRSPSGHRAEDQAVDPTPDYAFGTELLQPVLPAVRPILIGLDHDFSYLVLLGWRPRPRRTPSW